MKLSYFLMRNQDYEFKPEKLNGWLNLGSILTNPSEPESLLEDYWIVPPRDYMDVKLATQENVRINYEERQSYKDGVFTKFLESLHFPLGFNAAHAHEDVKTNFVALEKLETYFITPTKAYLDKVLKTSAVQTYIREKSFHSSPYIVTGLRVARRGSGMDTQDQTKKLGLDASVDTAAIFGAQGLVNIGPSIGHEKKVQWAKKYAGSSDYIYAYRVAKIYFSFWRNDAKARGIKGELFGVNERVERDAIEENAAYTFEAQMQEDEWFPTRVVSCEVDEENGAIRLFTPLT